MSRSVAIIGAGMAGLAAARGFIHEGWNVTVYEASAGVGGVWNSCYSFATLQTPSDCYYFGDFPFPHPVDELATAEQLVKYFKAFADQFKITERIRFNTRVNKIVKRADGKRGWRLETSEGITGASAFADFDFVVSAQGLYSGGPRMIKYLGTEVFERPILHSSQLKHHLEVLESPKIAIIGTGKTAADIAMYHAQNCTDPERETHLIFRTARWFAPYFMFGFKSPEIFANYRITGTSSDMWGKIWRFVRTGMRKDKVLNARELEKKVRKEKKEDEERELPATALFAWLLGYRADDSFKPKCKVAKQCAVNMQPPRFLDYLRSGRIQAHPQKQVTRLGPRSMHLYDLKEDGTIQDDFTIENVDAIILATGFKQTMIVPEGMEDLVESGGVFLYRDIIHPDIQDMAFLGNSSGVVTVIATSMAVHWLLGMLTGALDLPSSAEQHKAISDDRERTFKKCGRGRDLGAGGGGDFEYCDALCIDLGVSPLRKARKWWGGVWNPMACLHELFGKYNPKDYLFHEIEAEVADARAMRVGGSLV
ncbi:hypothetical protein BC830DRAFT_207164 [Chytriomyces sp. MP71]|nr:hypothetical protein BC830DRAFT_207164 [Chytriomyces sp. MP71]